MDKTHNIGINWEWSSFTRVAALEKLLAESKPPTQRNRSSRLAWSRFSIESILVVTAVMAFTAAGLAHLWRTSTGDIAEVGGFILFTNVAPLGLMILVSWVYHLSRKFNR